MSSKTSDKEARLAAYFAADEAPAYDPSFVALVMQRIATRRLLDEILDFLPLTAALLTLAIALWPAIALLTMAAAAALGIALPILFAAAMAGGTLIALRAWYRFAPAELEL